jgi:hypothetical protein
MDFRILFDFILILVGIIVLFFAYDMRPSNILKATGIPKYVSSPSKNN